MISATINNITKENELVSFYVQYSNGEERNYRLPIQDFKIEIVTEQIQKELEDFNSLEASFVPLKDYLGMVFNLEKGEMKAMLRDEPFTLGKVEMKETEEPVNLSEVKR